MSETKSITVTNEIQNRPFSGVKFHVQHKKYDRDGHEINHANKEIDFDRTKFNETIVDEKFDFLESKKSGTIIPKFILTKLAGDKSAEANFTEIGKLKPADFQEVKKLKPIERQLLEETILYDYKRIKAGHKEEIKKSIYDYVQGRKGVLQKRGIVTLGNKDKWFQTFSNYEQTLKNKNPEAVNEYFNRFNQAFKDYTEEFNHTFGENVLITKAVTNLDESTPHLHYELTMMSKKNGKISFSLNENLRQARERLTGKPAPKDSRENLRWFREKTDNMLMDAWNRNSTLTYQLKRTGEHTAKNQKIYKEIQEQKKRANCEIIRDYEPNARIIYGKDEQGNEVESDPIKTETGFKAYMSQSLAWLRKVKEKYQKRLQRRLAQFEKEKEKLNKERETFKREQAELGQDRSQFIDLSDKSLSDSLTVEEYHKKLENNRKASARQRGHIRLKVKPVTKKQNQKHGMSR
ncbi:hypothetical protein [Fructilactobacillus sanfranciscensis]|uniref:hypothetical protein n=3 Tax=Bacteria TaxID=2 RepID=UPI0013D1F986|nr:hypothetical protein [Fructilactobacillus sanfranciscensis]NDR60944.1 hypothetical protein [Fructilactobacillus sanfranciscensis]